MSISDETTLRVYEILVTLRTQNFKKEADHLYNSLSEKQKERFKVYFAQRFGTLIDERGLSVDETWAKFQAYFNIESNDKN